MDWAPRRAEAIDVACTAKPGGFRHHRPLRRPFARSCTTRSRPPSADRTVHSARMRLYNTLSRSEEEFAPADGKTVRMYTCGLTVYARGHIGNFRTFVSLDVLRRALKYQEGYEVRQVTNFTDVDDKTIAAVGGGRRVAARVHGSLHRRVP